eukprot:CAMPEP_0194399556 /NCGR_PEP_ID=MMETSP0174-20130528/126726_1 /TAXON_ID=216777 /ORGANISM="Proboscia alata, Strain PI-D3" /LENGTH=82 /DNA_ID=CAMNT_0039195979 /DNA_START=663 /DNA_END=908 /DNA_ORIENTATION=-
MRNASLFISVMSQLFSPLQGFFTFLIYIRPMLRRLREENPTPSYTTLVYKLLCKGFANDDDSRLNIETDIGNNTNTNTNTNT